MERCFYGSRHGKNRCDGEAGVVKQTARRAILNGEVVNDAKSFFKSVQRLETLPEVGDNAPCKHKLRKLLFVESNDIDRNRPLWQAKTLQGTRKVHSVRDCSSRAKLKTRRLSCFCHKCKQGNFEDCLNMKYVGHWKAVMMKPLIPNYPAEQDQSVRTRGNRGMRTRGGRGVRTRAGRGVRTRGGRSIGQQEGGAGQRRGNGGRGQGRRRRRHGRQERGTGRGQSSEDSSDISSVNSEDLDGPDEENLNVNSSESGDDDLIFPSPEESLAAISGLSGILGFLLESDDQLSPVYPLEDQLQITEGLLQITKDQQQITEDQPQITEHQPQITEDQQQITVDQPHITEHQPQITEDQPQITQDQQQITEHQQQITVDQPQITEDQQQITEDQPQITVDQQQITEDQQQITVDQPQITEDQQQITEDQPHITEHQPHITEHQPHITEDQQQITVDQQQITEDLEQITVDQQQITEDQPQITEDQPQITEDQPQMTPSYDSGQYIKVVHGKKMYPAVVSSVVWLLDGFVDQFIEVDKWPFVQFFTKKGNGCVANQVKHTVVADDVTKTLCTPDICLFGSRILYIFNDPDL